MEGVEKQFQLDPRIAVTDPVYTITKGGDKITYQNFASQSYSQTSLQFQVVPNSMGTYLDRKVLVSMVVDFTLTAANPADIIFPGGDPSESGVCGLRYMPLNNVPTNVQITLNNNTFSYNSAEIFAPMSCYNTPAYDLESQYWSYAPACKEPGQTFDQTFGTPRSSLASRWQNTLQDSNATIPDFQLLSNVAGQAVIRATWTEPILYPIFIHSQIEREGILGLNSAIVLTWTIGQLSRFLAYDNVSGVELSDISADWAVPPILRLNWITSANTAIANANMQMAYKYPFTNIVPFLNPPLLLQPGESATVQSMNVQLQGIPHCVYIFARERYNDRTPFDVDSYAAIDSINIIFNNQSGILANASKVQIHNICSQNGLKIKYRDWSSGVGSVAKLQFDKDIPIGSPDLAVGSAGTFQFTASVGITNINPDPIYYNLVLVICYEGILTIAGGSCYTNINLVTPMDVLHGASVAETSAIEYAEQASYGMVNGGSLITTASNFVRRGKKFYSENKGTIDSVLHVGKQLGLTALQVLPTLLGAGLSYEEARDVLSGAGFSGGGLSGGRLITSDMDLITGRAPATKPIFKRK